MKGRHAGKMQPASCRYLKILSLPVPTAIPSSSPPTPRLDIRHLKIGVPLSLSVFDATDPGDFAVLDSVEGDLRYVNMECALAELTPQLRQTPTMKASLDRDDVVDPCGTGSGVLAFFEEQFSRAIVIKPGSQTADGNPILWYVLINLRQQCFVKNHIGL